jgi:hypothetical protein
MRYGQNYRGRWRGEDSKSRGGEGYPGWHIHNRGYWTCSSEEPRGVQTLTRRSRNSSWAKKGEQIIIRVQAACDGQSRVRAYKGIQGNNDHCAQLAGGSL